MTPFRSLRTILSAAVLAAAATAAAPALAQENDAAAAAAKRNVNLSAMQGMLLQQMAKSACFAHLGEHPEANVNYIRGAQRQFAAAQSGLRTGSPSLGLVEETDPRVLIGLDKLDSAMSDLSPILTAVGSSGSLSDETLRRILMVSERAYAQAQENALRSEKIYGSGKSFPLAVSLRITLAARQRVLSQLMSKQFCLIAMGQEPEANRAALAETVDVFVNTQTALIDGFPAFGLPEERDPARREHLAFVQGLFDEVAPAYRAVIEGAEPTPEQIRLVSWQDKVILAHMNRAVFAYELGSGS